MTATATRRRKAAGITIPKATLLELLDAIGPAVPTRTPRPILQNVCLRDGTITANDLELQITREIDWPHAPLLLPHARLRSILKASAGDDVGLEIDGSACTVTVGRGEWRLPVEDAAEFPISEPTGLESVCRIPCDQFARAVRSVAYAADTTSSRFALGAVLIEVKGDTCSFVASDGRRLAAATVEHDQAVDDRQILITQSAALLIADVAGEKCHEEIAVQLEANRSHLVATIGSSTVTSVRVEGNYPRWRDVLPEREASGMHTLDLGALASATRAAAIVTTENSKGVDYAFAAGGLTLSGRSSESGESTVKCDLIDAGVGGTVKLDPAFVVETCRALSVLGEPNLRVSIAGPGDAVLLLCGEDDEYKTVIMPLAND